ncbi:ParB/RepB/Spo0J family partition protein [Actinomadura violacea]|uniref:ParB N-terminal domain-containing protein n=1 Tax=Actinomadura violacea TaxID=2819934 RepID=A0ABS3RJK5_9ACTN|nr:ParB/RepB/Spo0J family partition protein [Actinomadura violacea]MBO2456913.1 ParB N-terminal domain-containing protein [Actinomadura violacea]
MNLELAAETGEAAMARPKSADPLSLLDHAPEVELPVGSLVPGFHLRHAGTDPAHVRLLADAAGSVRFPSILVQRRGSRIIDGMHRVEVAKLRGEQHISARLVDCTDVEALVLAVKSNTRHGLPLSRADRISSAKRILTAHPDWSDRAVASITGLSAKAIASLRNGTTGEVPADGKRLGRDGKRRPILAAEGRRRAEEYIKAHPEASLRKVARETDVSLGTAHDVRERLRRAGEQGDCAERAERTGRLEPVGRAEPEQAATETTESTQSGPVPPPLPMPARGGGRGVQQLTWPMIAAKLANDPVLRYTQGGRAFLRWMDRRSMQTDEWREFIDAIPQHWLEDVVWIAVTMSEDWRQFAELLRNRREATG